jgi:hypothetical protein
MSLAVHSALSPAGGFYQFSNGLVGIDGIPYDVDYYDNGDRFVKSTGGANGWFPAGEPIPGLEFIPGGTMGIPLWLILAGGFILIQSQSKK